MKAIAICTAIIALAAAMTMSSFSLHWNPLPMHITVSQQPEGQRL